jgi:lactate dehydrogenase-like 2-hydroxyacid dehydrogenase
LKLAADLPYLTFNFSFETTFWTQPGPITRESLLTMIEDKEAIFCLLTDRIDRQLLENAPNLKVVGTLLVKPVACSAKILRL